jgi:flagellar biosynthetic protein FlhB
MAENQDRDQRTEEATPQRIRKSREDGQIGFSAELVGGVILAATAFFFWSMGAWFFGTITGSIEDCLTNFEAVIVDPRLLAKTFIDETIRIGGAVLAIVAPLGILAAAAGLLQTNFNISFKPLEFKPDKLSVIQGFKKIFSMQSVVRGSLSIAKATVIVGISIYIGYSKIEQISFSGFGSIRDLLFFLGGLLVYCSLAIASMMAFIGMIDLAFQKWKHLEDMKMSRQDIKEENRSTEGDPMVKARIRQIQAEMGRKRMFAEIPQASVVITNPTHFAVAIKYDRDQMDAPIVVAKGADFMAKKIIEIAKENGVPVVERKPVARFLYKNAVIGNAIPFELYQAVAEILNFVNRLRSGI